MFRATFRGEPALTYISALTALAAAVIQWRHLPPGQAAFASVCAIAAGTILTAALARPVNVALITGACGSVLAGLADVGLHLGSSQIAVATTAIGLVVGVLIRGHLTPLIHQYEADAGRVLHHGGRHSHRPPAVYDA